MKLLILFVLFVTQSLCKNINSYNVGLNDNNSNWWKNAIFYQIYPRSFKDSNNDGIGDIQGIIQKMDYIFNLDITAIWLSPIYKSPMVDGGYDISDYRDIAPEYGTLDDFKQLLNETHNRNMKLILDFVPNHSSDQHVWFNKSVNREEGYEDYYLWADAKYNDNGDRIPPNNWISVFQNSGWAWNEERQQYYFHQFTIQQPDLNYRSAKLQQEMKDILKYWLDIGVDGFRVDAVPHVYEDIQLRDEPVDPDSGVDDPNNYNYLQHIYTKDQQETFDLVYNWREYLDNYTKTEGGDTRIFMTECSSNLENVIRYYGNANGSILGAHFSFNFDFIPFNENSTSYDIQNILSQWLGNLPIIYTPNWLTGNHDNNRVASRVGTKNIDGYNMLIMFLPGITITYMAEEIGQSDGEVTCEQGQDPRAIGNCTTFNQTSRDFERTPFQWDDSVNAGFNDGADTWLPVSEKYLETNLAKEMQENRSHYLTYQELANIKSELVSLDTKILYFSPPDLLHITRSDSLGDAEYSFVFNLGAENQSVPLGQNVSGIFIVLSSSKNADYVPGNTIDNTEVNLKPGDSIIAKRT